MNHRRTHRVQTVRWLLSEVTCGDLTTSLTAELIFVELGGGFRLAGKRFAPQCHELFCQNLHVITKSCHTNSCPRVSFLQTEEKWDESRDQPAAFYLFNQCFPQTDRPSALCAGQTLKSGKSSVFPGAVLRLTNYRFTEDSGREGGERREGGGKVLVDLEKLALKLAGRETVILHFRPAQPVVDLDSKKWLQALKP